MRVNYTFVMLAVAAALLFLLMPEYALADATDGGDMPWEDTIASLSKSITGPVAYAVALMGVTVAGLLLLWGGEIGEFTRRVIMLVLVVSLIFGAASVIGSMQDSGAFDQGGDMGDLVGALIK